MSGFWHQNLNPLVIAAFLMIGANHCNASKFALGARHRGERYRLHARHIFKVVLQFISARQIPLAVGEWRQRMSFEEPRNTRDRMGAPRIVFHRAGPKRVKLFINGKVLGRQVGVMPDHFQFRHLRQPEGTRPCVDP